MGNSGIIGIILIIANIAFSYKGLTNASFFEAYKFEVDRILVNKDYKRFITSGFLHVSWIHLIFNMLSLYAFSGVIEGYLGEIKFLVIYFASLLGGGLLSLIVHRNHPDYSAVGASGAICGIMFASVALFPGMNIGFFGLPVSIPAWLFSILFIAFSIYGIKSGKDNIGHEAHLGGALVGMVVALLMQPSAFRENYLTILIIAVPTIVFIYLIVTAPYLLFIDNFYFKKHQHYYSVDHKYNEEKNNAKKEIDKILDKISRSGIESLSSKEKAKLKEYSQKIR
ncbi:MAG TPA: rhomboid family intramembrane serine protease [Chitinophagaceae bacterium]|nr:rhomboid family intramembrane serine protease [Chitinophagaceae bacterium]